MKIDKIKKNLILENFYKFKDNEGTFIGQYIGEADFGCCVCGEKGRVKIFNVFHSEFDYESFGYDKEHFPIIIEDLGTNFICN